MSGMQSTLDSSPGIAEELAEDQREISVAEFFEKNKHMLGFDSPARSLITATKEAVDNALDATEEAEILPTISIEVEELDPYYQLTVRDNGPGIPQSNIPNVFGKLLYGSRFGSLTQSRGQQGIGISAAVLYSQLTSGTPAVIRSKPKGGNEAYEIELTLDTDTNSPKIHSSRTIEWDHSHGTEITLEMEANFRARSQLHKYIQSTAVVNPHAKLVFDEPQFTAPRTYPRVIDTLPQKPEEIKPHPHGVELGQLISMMNNTDSHSVRGFLTTEFTRVGQTSADNITTAFIANYYGEQCQWDLTISQDEFTALVSDVIVRKDAESKNAFIDELYELLCSESPVSNYELETYVSAVSDAIEDEYGTVYGSTVQEKVTREVWDEILTSHDEIREQLIDIFDANTSKRKSTDAIETVASEVARSLSTIPAHELTQEKYETLVTDATETSDETFGETALDNILTAVWDRTTVPDHTVPKISEMLNDRDMIRALLKGMQAVSISRPSTKCLSPITAEHVRKGLEKEVDAEFYSGSTRDADVHSGHPFIVEAGIAYGGELKSEGKMDVMRFANRVPLVYQQGACAITQTIGDINWRNYKLSQPGGSGLPDGPVVLLVHVASTNVPFTSESKDAVASVPNIEHEVEQAVREVSRDLKKYLKKQKSRKKRRQKQTVIADILPEYAEKIATTLGKDTPNVENIMAKVMNNVNITRSPDTITITNHTPSTQSLTLVMPNHDPTTIPNGEAHESGTGTQLHVSLSSTESEHIPVSVSTDEFELIQATDIDPDRVTYTTNE